MDIESSSIIIKNEYEKWHNENFKDIINTKIKDKSIELKIMQLVEYILYIAIIVCALFVYEHIQVQRQFALGIIVVLTLIALMFVITDIRVTKFRVDKRIMRKAVNEFKSISILDSLVEDMSSCDNKLELYQLNYYYCNSIKYTIDYLKDTVLPNLVLNSSYRMNIEKNINIVKEKNNKLVDDLGTNIKDDTKSFNELKTMFNSKSSMYRAHTRLSKLLDNIDKKVEEKAKFIEC